MRLRAVSSWKKHLCVELQAKGLFCVLNLYIFFFFIIIFFVWGGARCMFWYRTTDLAIDWNVFWNVVFVVCFFQATSWRPTECKLALLADLLRLWKSLKVEPEWEKLFENVSTCALRCVQASRRDTPAAGWRLCTQTQASYCCCRRWTSDSRLCPTVCPAPTLENTCRSIT